MTKKDFVQRISKQTDLTQQQAGQVIDIILDNITSALKKGQQVQLRDFGTFRTVERAARKCRNPQTGETMSIPAKTVAKFRPAKKLAKAVN